MSNAQQYRHGFEKTASKWYCKNEALHTLCDLLPTVLLFAKIDASILPSVSLIDDWVFWGQQMILALEGHSLRF